MLSALQAASRLQGHEATASPPSTAVAVVAGGVAVLLVLGVWSLIGHVITIAHEGAHAAATLLLGGRVTQVRLNRDRTGSTASRSPLLQFPVTAAGYLGPSVFGLAGSALLVHGKPDAVLWITLVLLALLLLSTANWFGRFVLVVVGAGLFLVATQAPAGVRLLVACVWVWVLLVGGVLHVWDHRHGGADFAAMRSMTFVVPAVVWAALAFVAAVAALLVGGAWLIGVTAPPG
jgi:hypothetical protein